MLRSDYLAYWTQPSSWCCIMPKMKGSSTHYSIHWHSYSIERKSKHSPNLMTTLEDYLIQSPWRSRAWNPSKKYTHFIHFHQGLRICPLDHSDDAIEPPKYWKERSRTHNSVAQLRVWIYSIINISLPIVRKLTADRFYLFLLSYEDETLISAESNSLMQDYLLETDWLDNQFNRETTCTQLNTFH